MKNLEKNLVPTIWRTVRSVMNVKRLGMLKAVLGSSGMEFTVSDLARMFKVTQPCATNFLRMMNARGLLGVKRGRIKVFYNSDTDRTLPDSMEIRSALESSFTEDSSRGWEVRLIRIMKSFTHPNRLAMIVRLAEGEATIEDLRKVIGGCVKSIYHHLAFLETSGLVEKFSSFHSPTVFRLKPQIHPLARTLLRITLGRKERFNLYWNPPIGDDKDPATRAVLAKITRYERRKRTSDNQDCKV